jgi:hypothetical protein
MSAHAANRRAAVAERCGGITRRSNKELKLTKPALGASQLNSVFGGPWKSDEDIGMLRLLGVLVASLLLAFASSCFSPTGAYREWRSDTSRPSPSDLAGTWRVIAESAVDAAATGLPLADVESGFISFNPDGSCRGDLYPTPCGHFPAKRRNPSEPCRWAISSYRRPVILVTFGSGRESLAFELHRLESDPPILWQYICDPDAGEYLEFRRVAS